MNSKAIPGILGSTRFHIKAAINYNFVMNELVLHGFRSLCYFKRVSRAPLGKRAAQSTKLRRGDWLMNGLHYVKYHEDERADTY
mmetsp:Transcript_9765/g.15997  ORF Transcript_9765/g.15997 Transcript_9765/m.15997 type:complete len:84 (-) Transcript_9765:41-292(-)